MKRYRKIAWFVVSLGLIFLHAEVSAAVPSGPSRVYVKGGQLIVEKRRADGTLGGAKPYIIHGVTWSPATSSPIDGPSPLDPSDTVPYGFFFNWPNRKPQGDVVFAYWLRNEHSRYYLTDIPLLSKMNVNTVRVYIDFGDDTRAYKKILDEFYRNGIMVIMMAVSSRGDIDKKRYKMVVDACKDHPAILMWSLGNEWNLDYNRYWGYKTVKAAAAATERVAKQIKNMDKFHPVASCLGDRFSDEDPDNTVERAVRMCPNVDIWGLNIYRGNTFRDLFLQWQKITDKPMYLSEFGIDSFETTSFARADGIKVNRCEGRQNQRAQAEYAASLWREIVDNLSAFDAEKQCVGGTIHSFSDCLWKAGSYHASLGGLINYDNHTDAVSYGTYNNEGFYLPGGAPDDIFNEEHFGLVDADRSPKEAFWTMKGLYEKVGGDRGR
ncbi:MAG: glycoside hydrolase family 2 TIM barrel-domain containing protein [Candidatus Omnitrophota bacterium]